MGTNPQSTGSVQMVAQLAGAAPPGGKEPGANQTKEPLLNRSTASPRPDPLNPPPASTKDEPQGAAPQNLPPRPPPATEHAPVRVHGSDEPAPANGTQEVSLLATTGDPTQRHTVSQQKEVQGGSVSSKGEAQGRECRAGGAPGPPLQGGGAPAERGPLSENASHCGASNNQRPGKGPEPLRPGPGGSSPRPEDQGAAPATAACPGPACKGPDPPASENLNGLSEAEADRCPGQRPSLTPPAKPDQVTSAPGPALDPTAGLVPPGPALDPTAGLVPPGPALDPTAGLVPPGPALDPTAGLVPPGPALDPTAGLVPPGPALDPTAGLVPPGPALDPTAGRRSPQPPQSAGASGGTSGVAPAGRGPPPAYSSLTGADKHLPATGPKRYSEASTMTCGAGAVRGRDVEVQAVAATCSRAVSTSPSLLPLSPGLGPRVGPPTTRDQDQSLAVLYGEGSAGAGPGLARLPTGPPRICMDSIVCAVDHDLGRPGSGPRLCSDLNANLVLHEEAHPEGRPGPAPEDPVAGPPLKPVYQINIEHSAQRGGKMDAATPAPAGPRSAAPPAAPLSEPPAGTPTTQAPPHQPPPPQGPAGPDQPKPAGCVPTAAQPQSRGPAGPGGAAPSLADPSPKPTGPAAGTKGPRDPPRPGPKAKGVGAKPTPEPETRKKKDREEEEEEEQEKGVHEVVWDEQGMTWEVYGAGVDPESLGFAIQSHLQCKIKEQERKLVTRTSQRKSTTAAAESPRRPQKKPRQRRNIFRSMLRNVRRPPCCSRPSPASVLE